MGVRVCGGFHIFIFQFFPFFIFIFIFCPFILAGGGGHIVVRFFFWRVGRLWIIIGLGYRS
jgi:hypothetical protein